MNKLTFEDLRNESENTFTDISSEEFRLYVLENGKTLRIESPLALSVSASGGHRVLDANGRCYYVAPVWVAIEWKAKDGQPHFVK